MFYFVAVPQRHCPCRNGNNALQLTATQMQWSIWLYRVKTQYLQILNIVDTSIKRQISVQSTTVVKRLYVHMFDVVDTAFSYGRVLIVC